MLYPLSYEGGPTQASGSRSRGARVTATVSGQMITQRSIVFHPYAMRVWLRLRVNAGYCHRGVKRGNLCVIGWVWSCSESGRRRVAVFAASH